MNDSKFLTALYSFAPFGPARIKLLITYFKGAKNVWNSGSESLLETGLKKDLVDGFLEYKVKFNFEKYFNELKRLNINYLTYFDSNYPSILSEIDAAPCVLYVKGSVKFNQLNSVAIVGARKMTAYGREVAETLSYDLASLGVVIISGLARGIDTAAHKGALNANGKTIAVLGCGLDSVYPSENKKLADEIVNCKGAVISEYPLGYPALRTNFASRNRIISGLAKAVVVVEGEKKSGTLLTASHAANQGKTVFAIPGQITSPMSAAPHFLIQNGAKIAFSVNDILEELDLQLKVDRDVIEKVLPSSKEEEKLLEVLSTEELHLDEIVRISGMSVGKISATLTVMEMKGMVKSLGGGIYKKN